MLNQIPCQRYRPQAAKSRRPNAWLTSVLTTSRTPMPKLMIANPNNPLFPAAVASTSPTRLSISVSRNCMTV